MQYYKVHPDSLRQVKRFLCSNILRQSEFFFNCRIKRKNKAPCDLVKQIFRKWKLFFDRVSFRREDRRGWTRLKIGKGGMGGSGERKEVSI